MSNQSVQYQGKSYPSMREVARVTGIDYNRILRRVKAGLSIDEVVEEAHRVAPPTLTELILGQLGREPISARTIIAREPRLEEVTSNAIQATLGRLVKQGEASRHGRNPMRYRLASSADVTIIDDMEFDSADLALICTARWGSVDERMRRAAA